MAHKGKNYKVWFRRDVSNVSNYKDGYAEGYFLRDMTGVDGSPWFPRRLIKEVGVNLEKEIPPFPTWTMPHELPIGAPLRWRFIPEDWLERSVNTFRFQILVTFDFRILDIRCRREFNGQGYDRYSSRVVTDVIVKDSAITLTPAAFYISLDYADYSRYNP